MSVANPTIAVVKCTDNLHGFKKDMAESRKRAANNLYRKEHDFAEEEIIFVFLNNFMMLNELQHDYMNTIFTIIHPEATL